MIPVFVKFLIITIIVLWVIRGLFRAIFPVMLRKAFGMENQSSYQKEQPRPRQEGSISIDYVPKKDKKGNIDKLGDFVDYEEVK